MLSTDTEQGATETVAEAEKLLAHYVSLAKQPAWKAYSWHRVNEMAKDYPEWFADFPQRLTAAVKAG